MALFPRFSILLLFFCLLMLSACDQPEDNRLKIPMLQTQESGIDALIIGISPVDENIVWVAGTGGNAGRTVDGGANWAIQTVPGADSLQFRDVHGVDENTAYILSIGNGADSRIYKTTDGGASWTLQFTNPIEEAFYDCFDFWDADHGMVFSDAVEGAFPVLRTRDGGATWDPVALPPANGSEGGFASSGTCLQVHGDSMVWIGTGAGDSARLLKSDNRGTDWISIEVPVDQGSATSGITSIHFTDMMAGIIAGGDIASPDAFQNNVATTADGGSTWVKGGQLTFPGALYGVSYVPETDNQAALAAGPGGVDVTLDGAKSWINLDSLNYWSVAFASSKVGWVTGTEGKISKIVFE